MACTGMSDSTTYFIGCFFAESFFAKVSVFKNLEAFEA